MSLLFNWFVKITSLPFERFLYKRTVVYQDRSVQGPFIKGRAIIVSNHTSVQDYAFYVFVFFTRHLRCMAAEILYQKNIFLSFFLHAMGCIRIDRNTPSISYLAKSMDILKKNGVVLIFPEGRIPLENESSPLQFNPGFVYLAHISHSPLIPVHTDGKYFGKKRARIVVGKPIDVSTLWNDNISTRKNLDAIASIVRKNIIELGRQLQ